MGVITGARMGAIPRGKTTSMIFCLLSAALLLNVLHISHSDNKLLTSDDHGPHRSTLSDQQSPVVYQPFKESRGPNFHIYRPYDADQFTGGTLLATPEVWIGQLLKRFQWLDTMTTGNSDRIPLKRSQKAYLEMLKSYVTGIIFGTEERAVYASLSSNVSLPVGDVVADTRNRGLDWAYLGVTMTGNLRLDNVEALVNNVTNNNIPGDYMEAGVWRGGSSIYARGVLRSLGQGHRRSFVCDSFRGLPPGDKKLHEHDMGWDDVQYLGVPDTRVASFFHEAGLLDSNVVFCKGFFNETMKPLTTIVDSLSIIRLDGDIYESTVDVLYHLYDKLSIGGYVIMDDWFNFPSKIACEDFFSVHGIKPEIVQIDDLSIYWIKTEQVQVQYWRYVESKFKDVTQ